MEKVMVWMGVAVAVLAGCGDDEKSAANGTSTGAGAAGGAGGAGLDPAVAALFECDETDFAESMPFTGPGIDDETGTFAELSQSTYVVHSTLLFHTPDGLNEIFALSGDIIAELQDTPGFVAVSFAGSDACQNVRTLGVWESEEAMFAFVVGEAHGKAMAQTANVSITGKTTHWTATADEITALDWDAAKAKIAAADPLPAY